MRKRKMKRKFIDIGMKDFMIPMNETVSLKQTENYHKTKHRIIPTIKSVTDKHEVIHGEHAIRKQVPKKYHRHTDDIDIFSPTPYIDAKEAERKLEKLSPGDDFVVKRGNNPGTHRVIAKATKKSVADYTKPDGKMPPHRYIDGHNYVTLGYIKKHNREVLSNPFSSYRHAKDQDSLNRIILSEKRRKR